MAMRTPPRLFVRLNKAISFSLASAPALCNSGWPLLVSTDSLQYVNVFVVLRGPKIEHSSPGKASQRPNRWEQSLSLMCWLHSNTAQGAAGFPCHEGTMLAYVAVVRTSRSFSAKLLSVESTPCLYCCRK